MTLCIKNCAICTHLSPYVNLSAKNILTPIPLHSKEACSDQHGGAWRDGEGRGGEQERGGRGHRGRGRREPARGRERVHGREQARGKGQEYSRRRGRARGTPG